MTGLVDEKDTALKFQLMRYLWNQGFFVRRNVSLEQGHVKGRRAIQYTDIDVLAVRVEPTLSTRLQVADCKSGQGAKTAERLFWLKGVMDFVGAESGYFLRTNLVDNKYREIASQLRIAPLSADHLSGLEKSMGTSEAPYLGPFSKNLAGLEHGVFQRIPPNLAYVRAHLLVGYWQSPLHKRITGTVQCLQGVRRDKSLSPLDRLFLQGYASALLALAICSFSNAFIATPPLDRESHIQDALLGGTLEARERHELMGGFYDFLVAEIRQRYDSIYPITRQEFLSSLTAPYVKYLVDFIERGLLAPRGLAALPRLLDLVVYEGMLGKGISPSAWKTLGSLGEAQELNRSLKDFAAFLSRSELVDAEFGKQVLALAEPMLIARQI